jgi:ubiquinone/menaquinone biosynthesis C-methylase UbiE
MPKKKPRARRKTKAETRRVLANRLRKARIRDRKRSPDGWPALGWPEFENNLSSVNRYLNADLEKEIKKKARGRKTALQVLDLGCGAGVAARELAKKVKGQAKITGTSVARLKEWTEEKNPENLEWRVAQFQKLAQKFPANKFDLIYSHNGLMHDNNLKKALENARDVLKTGGILVFNDIKSVTLPKVEGLELVSSEESSGYIAHRLKKVRINIKKFVR